MAFPVAHGGVAGRRALVLAASVLLAVSLALAGALTWQQRLIRSASRDLESAAQKQADSERERRRIERIADELQRANEQRERRYQQQITDLESRIAGGADPLVEINPPLLAFRMAQTVRGETRTLTLSPRSRLVLLVFPLDDTRLRYRLEIFRRSSGERILSESGLEAGTLADLTVVVPASLLSAGEYRLRLDAVGEAGDTTVAEYGLTVEVDLGDG